AKREPRQDRPAGRVGERRKGSAEGVGGHLYFSHRLNNLWVKYDLAQITSTAKVRRSGCSELFGLGRYAPQQHITSMAPSTITSSSLRGTPARDRIATLCSVAE